MFSSAFAAHSLLTEVRIQPGDIHMRVAALVSLYNAALLRCSELEKQITALKATVAYDPEEELERRYQTLLDSPEAEIIAWVVAGGPEGRVLATGEDNEQLRRLTTLLRNELFRLAREGSISRTYNKETKQHVFRSKHE